MSRWQMTQALVLLCGALAVSACDDVLEGKEDEHHNHESEEDPDCCSSGGGSSHGGGTIPGDDDDEDVDDDDIETGKPDAGASDDDADTREAPVVETESGELIGSYSNSKVRSFLGIPYA
ncbi:MAG TPA: hypothetical protein VFN67_29685, partial [Polyangiales bacterium]|nr:hypothetical protein [Polyangiales bacterium]